MDKQNENFYPTDYLQQINKEQAYRIMEFIFIDRETQAIQMLMEEADFSLENACQTVRAVKCDQERRFPLPVKPETTILAALGQDERAAERVQAYTGNDLEECRKYVGVISKMLPLRVTVQQAEELLQLELAGKTSEAADKIWTICSIYGYAKAVDFCRDLSRHYQNAISPDLPSRFRYPIPPKGERYTITSIKVTADPELENLITKNFPEKVRGGVLMALSLYGGHCHEMGVDRVVRAIIKQSEGDEKVLLSKVGYAKIDFRDVLMGEYM